jgi:hypothetical protein
MKTIHLVGTLLLVALLSGCRMYGDHGSEEAMYHQILIAIDELEAETSMFEARLGAVSRQLTVDEHDRMAATRSQLVQEYRQIADRLSPRSGHRELRRIYGSIISDRQILYDQLDRLESMQAETDESSPMRIADPRAQYQIVPVFYHRLGLERGQTVGPPAGADTTAADIETPESAVTGAGQVVPESH